MELTAKLILALLFFAKIITAQSNIVVKIDTKSPGNVITPYFNGVSFETQSLLPDNAGVKGYFFDSTNKQLITLFKNLGIKNLRIGGGTVDIKSIPIPNHKDIDALFKFAKAAGVKVIYSLRLQNGDPYQDASIAKYIWDNYKEYLDCFAVGNEPDYGIGKKRDQEITNYSTFLTKWRKFPNVIRDSVPNAKIGGPDAAHWTWSMNFARDEYGTGSIESIYLHYYAGGNTRGKTTEQLVNAMLSAEWDTVKYPNHFKDAESTGLPYRFTESNCYVTQNPKDWGYHNGYSIFATALFSLDFMHWWAKSKNCLGVGFHTRQWKYNGTFYMDVNGNYQIYPIGYGIAAFNLSGHGKTYPVSISNPDGVNLTAYAVGSEDTLNVTIINKEYGKEARNAEIKIESAKLPKEASVIYLTAPKNNPAAMTGILLGGKEINSFESFNCEWKTVNKNTASDYMVNLPVTSAVIIRFIKD